MGIQARTALCWIVFAAMMASCFGVANAGITVDATETYASPGNENISVFTLDFSGFNPSGSDKLVVTVSGRGAAAGTTLVDSVSFNGQAMASAKQQQNERIVTAVFYLDDPPTGGNLVITFSQNVYAVGVSLIALSGTADGYGPTDGASSLSSTITTTEDGTLVVAACHYFIVADGGTVVTPSTITPVLSTALYYAGAGAGYHEVASAGSFTYTFTASGGSLQTAAAVGFEPGTGSAVATVTLTGNSVVSNAAPGTLVGTLSMANTNGTFAYAMETDTGDDTYFDIASGTSNLRTKAWINKASYAISIIGTEVGGGSLVVTNAFTITVDPATQVRPAFVVAADVQVGAFDGTVIGTAETTESGATYSIVSGRDDLFYVDGADVKVTNSASWGSIGTTNYVTLRAVVGSGVNELVVAAGVVSGTTGSTIFLFR